VSHIENKEIGLQNFLLFNQRLLKFMEEEEWGNLGNQDWIKNL
jgi:hypothetical protein